MISALYTTSLFSCQQLRVSRRNKLNAKGRRSRSGPATNQMCVALVLQRKTKLTKFQKLFMCFQGEMSVTEISASVSSWPCAASLGPPRAGSFRRRQTISAHSGRDRPAASAWTPCRQPVPGRNVPGGFRRSKHLPNICDERWIMKQMMRPFLIPKYYDAAAAAFLRTARKFRYSISCGFISVRGTMASMRPRSRRNSAV